MDPKKLADMLKATLDPAQRLPAEEQLNQVHKIIGFVPTLLQIVIQNDMEMPVRQAAAIYLKNMVNNNWQDKEANVNNGQIEFSIHEQDRAMLRDSVVDAIVHTPDILRAQLGTCIYHMVKCDFPQRWTQIVDKISIYLQNRDFNGWSGALLALYQLVKIYEYKKADERTPLTEAMNLLLPMIYQLMISLMSSEQTEPNVLLQKQILKIFHTLTQYCLPLDLITNEVFSQWMEICRTVINSPVPDSSQYDEDFRPELPWWKAKKWALHICVRTFERYGSPGHVVNKEYQKFAEWYLPTFTGGILESLLKVLDQYRNKIYVSPRVLTECLNYIKTSVTHAYSWKLIKPHMLAVIQDVVFPIMQYSDADAELWETDETEYIRSKFDIYDDYSTPVPSAQALFHACCKTRKGILQKAMQFLMTVINSPHLEPKQKDGALYMIGSLADILLKKKEYRDQIEQMLTTYIFPEFNSPHGHLRARACWVLHNFGDIKFKNQNVLIEILRLATNALLNDKDLPVKVEAAIVLQVYLTSQQDDAARYIESQIKPITIQLLTVIRETENDDLTNVMQKIVYTFSEHLVPIAVEICEHLATTFSQVIESEEGSDDKAVTAMGLINTIETLLSVFEEKPEITAHLQPIVMRVIYHILQNSIMEFYEEAFSLVYDLTAKAITPEMWQMLELIYQVFKKDGFDYFLDLMPALHNYVTVDTPAFLSNPNYVLAIFDMCKTILTNGEAGEDPECHAAKLLEVIILQCKGQIDTCIPSFVELVLGRLMQEVKSSELRTMCLQVLIAALYYNPELLLQILEKLQSQLQQLGGQPLSSHFVKQWIADTDCFLGIHDRKLYVLGLCTAMSLGGNKPPILNELAEKVLPSLLLIFEGLKRAYHARAQEGEEEESEDEDDEDCEEALSSDEDEIDELSNSYLENLENFATQKANKTGLKMNSEIKEDDDTDTDDDSDDDFDEPTLESYLTPIDDEESENPIDEYIIFQQVIQNLTAQDPLYYALLTQKLNAEQVKNLDDLMVVADQKKAQYASKKIEKQGGYAFPQQTVPTSFNFGS